MVKATLTLVIALIASVIGTPIQTKVKRRSVSNRILRTLHEPLLGSNRKSLVSLSRSVELEPRTQLGKAMIDGSLQPITQHEAYELYTLLTTHEERRAVLAPHDDASIFGTCQTTNRLVWPGNCERVDGESYTVCRSPATRLIERRDSHCRPLPISIVQEAHPTQRTGVAMVDGQLINITRAEAYQLQNTIETNSKRSILAVKEHLDVDFGECSIIETINWPGNCQTIANIDPSDLSMCRVPSTLTNVLKYNGCINGDSSTILDYIMSRGRH